MYEISIRGSERYCLGTILFLPGRDGNAVDIMKYYENVSELKYTRLIAVQPLAEWYPAPNGPEDQEAAIWGLKLSVPEFDSFVCKLEKEFSINRSDIALVGYSAGAVMAIETASVSGNNFAAVVSHSGAILEPSELVVARNKTPILLIHSKDDDCFEWEERYLPMKSALINKKYNVNFIENDNGGHSISYQNIVDASIFLAKKFKYHFWRHSTQYSE